MYERLLELCEIKDIKITRLCEEVTNSPGNLATWKKGYMRSDYLSKCADILGVSTDYLLGRERPVLAASAPINSNKSARMLEMFQLLSEEKQEFLLKQAEMYLDAEKPEEKKPLSYNFI